MTVRNKGSYK